MCRIPSTWLWWCALVAAIACDVEQDLGHGADEPGPLVIEDGEVVYDADVDQAGQGSGGRSGGRDVQGGAGVAGTPGVAGDSFAPVPTSFSCPVDELWLCLSRVTSAEHFTGGGESPGSRSHVRFDAEGNRYLGYDSGGLDLLVSYSADGRPRWMHHRGRGATQIELGSDRLCAPGGMDSSVAEAFRDRNAPRGDLQSAAIACYDLHGRELWWRYLDVGDGYAVIHDLALDDVDNVYVVGQIAIEGTGGGSEAFALKLLPSGELAWVHLWSGEGADFAYRVVADQQGVRVLGALETRLQIGGVALEHDPIFQGPSVWLASLTPEGQTVFASILPAPDIEAGGLRNGALIAHEPGGTVAAIERHGGFPQVFRADMSGALTSTTLEGPTYLDAVVDLARVRDGFVIGGTCGDELDTSDVCLVLLDYRLRHLTSGRYGRPYAHGEAGKLDALESMAVAPDSALHIAGRTAERRDLDPTDPFFAVIERAAPLP